MPKITITSLGREIFSTSKTQSILSAIQENQIDWFQSCGGKGKCTTCSFDVVKGGQHLSKPTRYEMLFYDQKLLTPMERLACQCYANDDIVVRIPKQNRLPHIQYLDSNP